MTGNEEGEARLGALWVMVTAPVAYRWLDSVFNTTQQHLVVHVGFT